MRTTIEGETAATVGPYSHGVTSGSTLYCSGQTPLDPRTNKLVEGTIGDRTHQCFDNLFDVLARAGLGPDHVVKVNVFLTNMADFDEMNQAYAERFAAPFPARTTIGVSSLPLQSDIEIELIAIAA